MSSILAGPAAARTPRRSSAAGGSWSDRRDQPPIPRTPAVRRGGPALRVTRQNNVILFLLFLGLLWLGGGAANAASLTPEAREMLRRMPIQHQGRVKPFDTFARETIKQLTGNSRIHGQDPVDTLLSMIAEPDRWRDVELIAVPSMPLREALGMEHRAARISYNRLTAERKLMRMLPEIVEKERRSEPLSPLDHEAMDVYERFVAFSRLTEQELAVVPPPATGRSRVWLPITEPAGYPEETQQQLRGLWSDLLTVVREPAIPDRVVTAAAQLTARLRELNSRAYPRRDRVKLELRYNTTAPFRKAQIAYALAGLALLVSVINGSRRASGAGMIALLIGAAFHAWGIGARVVIGGRPPVSNFYETMLWLPFVAVVLGLVLERLYRTRYLGCAAAILAAITLTLADIVPLDSSISPVVAVLRSNLWLTVHVLTIVASYGALALAAVAAHLYAGLSLAGRKEPLVSLDLLIYRALQVGVVLLAGGIMLGAVWANASWGRYWGWDPKETWALITLLWFLAVLHGRFAGWLKGLGVAASTIGGFFLLLMTYYGVSFYLVGLHAYAGGHARPLPPLLIAYFVLEAAFLAFLGYRALRRKTA